MAIRNKTILKIKLLVGTLVLSVLIISVGTIFNIVTSKDASAQCVELFTADKLCVRHAGCYNVPNDDSYSGCPNPYWQIGYDEDEYIKCCRPDFYQCS